MRYLQIQIKGYRVLADVTLDLHPLTVMIGPNGCGKTSLLDVFHLLKEASQERLDSAISSQGGITALLTYIPDVPSRLEIALQVDVASPRSPEPISYRFVLEPLALGYAISLERLEWHFDSTKPQPYRYIDANKNAVYYIDPEQKGPRPPDWDYNPRELALAQVPRMYVEPETLRNTLSKTLYLSFLDVRPDAVVRRPQALTPATLPGRNGEALFAALYNMRESRASRPFYERVEETLHLAFPDFDHLELRVVGAGQITLAWHEKSLTVPLYPTQLSEGTLRFLWLATALLSPEPPPLILIDEPEISLHPELLQILAALMRDASARTQLLVATHSSDLIRWLRPDEVVVIDKHDGKSKFTGADDPSLNLEEWLKEYTLADLWLMGNLGGRP